MIFDWFLITNLDDFDDLEVVSRSFTMILEGYGIKEILVTKGNTYGVVIDDVFLSVNLNDENPMVFDGHAVFVDDETNDLYIGFETEEED